MIRPLRPLCGDPQLRVDLVAHTAGGPVTRDSLRFGATDVLDRDDPEVATDAAGASAVRRTILIGTPNYGSVSALQGAIMGGARSSGEEPRLATGGVLEPPRVGRRGDR